MNIIKILENQEKAIYTTLRANTLDEPRTRSALPNRIAGYGVQGGSQGCLGNEILPEPDRKIPANRVHAMRVPGYLCASDLHLHQTIKLTIAGVSTIQVHSITGGWREISFTEIPERVVCNPISRSGSQGSLRRSMDGQTGVCSKSQNRNCGTTNLWTANGSGRRTLTS